MLAVIEFDLVREIALAHAFGAGKQLVHRSRDGPRQRQPGHERRRFDDEKEHADDDEHQEERLAEGTFAGSLRGNPLVDLADAQAHGHHEHAAALPRCPVDVLEERHRGLVEREAARANRRRFVGIVRAPPKGRNLRADASDIGQLGARLLPQLLPDALVDQQIDHDTESWNARLGKGDRADQGVGGDVARRNGGDARGLLALSLALVRQQTHESAARHPGGNGGRRLDVRPGSGGVGSGRWRCAGRRRGRVTGTIHRHHGERRAGKLAGDGSLPPRQNAGDVTSARALNLGRGGRSNRERALAEHAEPILHQVRAEVRKQQHASEQEERDDQDRRDETNKDVRDDQLAADAPEQPSPHERHPPNQEVAAAGGDRERPRGVEHADGRGHPAGDDPQEEDGELDRQADDDRPTGQRSKQRAPHDRILEHVKVDGS